MKKTKTHIFMDSKTNILEKLNPEDLGKFSIIVAHPDDETLFASSLVQYANEIIICFSKNELEKKISYGRDELKKKFLLDNATFLELTESTKYIASAKDSKISNYGLFAINKNHTESVLRFLKKNKGFQNTSNLMSSIIKDSLKGKESVITHSPWGDYGNIEHINVFDSTFKACQSIGVALYCFGYSSQYTYRHMREYLDNSRPDSILTLKTNKLIFKELEALYKSKNCWTWYENYILPTEETFIKLFPQSATDELKSFGKRIKINIINVRDLKLKSYSLQVNLNNHLKSLFIINYYNFMNKFFYYISSNFRISLKNAVLKIVKKIFR